MQKKRARKRKDRPEGRPTWELVSVLDLPVEGLAGHERHDAVPVLRRGPRLADERQPRLAERPTVELSAEPRREVLHRSEGVAPLEDRGERLHRDRCGEDAGAPAVAFLAPARMRRRIGP